MEYNGGLLPHRVRCTAAQLLLMRLVCKARSAGKGWPLYTYSKGYRNQSLKAEFGIAVGQKYQSVLNAVRQSIGKLLRFQRWLPVTADQQTDKNVLNKTTAGINAEYSNCLDAKAEAHIDTAGYQDDATSTEAGSYSLLLLHKA